MAIHMFLIEYPQIMFCLQTFQLPPGDLSRLKTHFKTSAFLCLPGFHSKSLLALLYLLLHSLYLMPVLNPVTFFSILKFIVLTNNFKETFSKILKEHVSLYLWKSYTNPPHSSAETLRPNVWKKSNILKAENRKNCSKLLNAC